MFLWYRFARNLRKSISKSNKILILNDFDFNSERFLAVRQLHFGIASRRFAIYGIASREILENLISKSKAKREIFSPAAMIFLRTERSRTILT